MSTDRIDDSGLLADEHIARAMEHKGANYKVWTGSVRASMPF
jgi:hypothetical protein